MNKTLIHVNADRLSWEKQREVLLDYEKIVIIYAFTVLQLDMHSIKYD